MPCYNLHIHGNGADYADPLRKFATMEGAFLLITKDAGDDKMTLRIKNHEGTVLDTHEVRGQSR